MSFAGSTPCTTSSSARHPTRSGSTWTSRSQHELRERLDALGYGGEDLERAFLDWAGTENLEERVKGIDRLDPVVLAELRRLA